MTPAKLLPITLCKLFFCWILLAGPALGFLQQPVRPSPSSNGLFLSKKKAAAGPTKTKKIQVKMLKDVPGTGQKGDVVLVTPAFLQNKLMPTHAAEVITEEEVAVEQAQKAAALAEEKAEATVVKELLETKVLKLKRKAGPEGHLFGGIGPKTLMEEVESQFAGHEAFFNRKTVKIVAIKDATGQEMSHDIKQTGDFEAQIALTKDIKGSIKISVIAE
jgi:large subunit ribosomal protein L9